AKVARKIEPTKEGAQHRDLRALAALLGGSERASVALVGPTGSGKTAWLRAALAEPGARSLYATSGAELVAGQSGLGQLEGRVERILKAAELLDVGVYFESFDDMFAGRTGGYEDIASLMQRWIQRRRVRILGELTPEGYDRLEHRNVGFFSYMYRFNVQPLGRAETLSILGALARASARQGIPALEDGAAGLLLDLAERYDPYRVLPGRAIALLDDLVARRSAEPISDRPSTIGA